MKIKAKNKNQKTKSQGKNEAPRSYTRGILQVFGGAESAEAELFWHSSTDLHPWCSAKADKKIFRCFWLVFMVFGLWFLALGTNAAEIKKQNYQKQQSASFIPNIYPRSSWSNATYDKRTKKVWPAEYENPEVIIIHHTATNYKYSASKQIKKIYKYHSYTKKWGDIGYNYIIGEDGSIFQGRYGGNGAIGGHAYNSKKKINYNSGSIGISVLGNYESKKLSSAAQESLQKLVGWLAANNNISIKSDIEFHTKSLNNSVVGHRDVDSTACPGKNIYNLMPDIRTNAADLSGLYQNYAYQISGEEEKYEITGGKRYAGSVRSSVVQISRTQMEAYPTDGIAETGDGNYAYPSGTLLQSGEKRGVLENGVLRVIGSSSALESSFSASNFVEVTEEKWNSYSSGPAALWRSGTFVKDENGDYYILNGNQKRKLNLPSEEEGLIDLGSARAVSDSEISQYPQGEDVASAADLPEGVIVTSDNKKFFYISGSGTKKKITKNVFRASFSSPMAVRVSGKLLDEYKTREKLSFQSGAVVSYHGKYYFIENGQRRQFTAKSLAKRMGYQNIVKAKRTEMSRIGKGAKIE